MSRKVLVFFPQNPYPPKSGAQKHLLEILAGLRKIGCSVTLASWTVSLESKWSRAGVERLKREYVDDVRVYEPSLADYARIALLYSFYIPTKRLIPFDSRVYAPPGLCRWFRILTQQLNPDIVLINYAHWDRLLDHREMAPTRRRIIHAHDLVSLNRHMQYVLKRRLAGPTISASVVDDDIVQEDFFDRLGLSADADELGVYDRYDDTIVLSAYEAEYIRQHTARTRVTQLSVTQEPHYISNSYEDAALFPVGPNLFNIQGYLYFVKRVLPYVRERAPSFSLHVTGSWYMNRRVVVEDGIVWCGFVPDLKTVYASSRFVICPVFGQTGQQIKIVEAMAHGLPVIALSAAAARSPIQHGVNGLVAHTVEEFAEYTVQLWSDRELCRRLGEAARETIAHGFSDTRLLDDLLLLFKE